MLRGQGHNVREFTRDSDELIAAGYIGKMKGALCTAWNPFMMAAVQKIVAEFRPDVVHIHNTFPLLSPGVLYALGKGPARVVTLHNYRLFCSAGIPMRAGNVCTECLEKRSVWPALRHGCYRNSRISTIPIAASVSLHRLLGTWTERVDAFIALTSFQRVRMVEAGLPADRVFVKPNFYAGNPRPLSWGERGDYAVFAGRLSTEKGVETLSSAWMKWGASAPELRIVGDGPLMEKLRLRISSTASPRIKLMGQLSVDKTREQIGSAKLLVVPSECLEGFPMVLSEAFAFGTPVAVSDMGPLPNLVRDSINGVVFPPANPTALLERIKAAWNDSELLQELSKSARRSFDDSYTEGRNHEDLMDIYQSAIRNRQH
jgi:glycosyltransferase involved in cell wall biosynthesis